MTPLLLGLALAVAAPQAKDRPKDESALVGEWELESRTEGGAPVAPFSRAGKIHYTFTAAGECVVSVGPGIPPGRKSYTADPKADPSALDMVQDVAGRASAGAYIYKVDGDTLSLCWDRGPGAARPKKLESPAGSEVVLYVFKRVKAKE